MSREKIFQSGNVAVVTGAGLGIGRAMCRRFAEAGMSVAMVDLPSDDFDEAVASVEALAAGRGQEITAMPADVSDPEQIKQLRDDVLAKFGKLNVLANNAVTRIGRGFDAAIEDWRRAMEVNLWGPVNAVRCFLPDMIGGSGPGVIINVGSKQGITNPPGHPIYSMTKSALKTYTEALEHELRSRPDNAGADRVRSHLLVPGWTTTGKAEHESGAWLPEQVVDRMMGAVAKGDFYIICPDGEVTEEADRKRILWAAGDITENRPPLSRWHPDYSDLAKNECS